LKADNFGWMWGLQPLSLTDATPIYLWHLDWPMLRRCWVQRLLKSWGFKWTRSAAHWYLGLS